MDEGRGAHAIARIEVLWSPGAGRASAFHAVIILGSGERRTVPVSPHELAALTAVIGSENVTMQVADIPLVVDPAEVGTEEHSDLRDGLGSVLGDW